jgi:hypothetical protein
MTMMTPGLWRRNRRGVGHHLIIVDCLSNTLWQATLEPPLVPALTPASLLSKKSLATLGQHGVRRYEEFWSYPDGWDFGEGKALSTTSIELMDAFLRDCDGFQGTPSVFLTRAGNLMLGWEDAQGEPIELEFGPGEGFLLYLSASDEERAYSLEQMPELLESLSHVTT